MRNAPQHVVVVGAGLTGIAAALEAERLGASITMIERDTRIGGRVKTDEMQGFLLDHGFQVLQDAYPEVKNLGLICELKLQSFLSGAVCHELNSSFNVVHPIRHPILFLQSLRTLPPSVYLDFVRLATLISFATSSTESTAQLLSDRGISDRFLKSFIKPFFGGVFLDTELRTRADLFCKYLRQFFFGRATLPQGGMQALPKNLFARLKRTELRLQTEVKEVEDGSVRLFDGSQISADAVILAVDNPALKRWSKGASVAQSHPVKCFYYAVKEGLLPRSTAIHLGHAGPISNLCIPNHVQPSYAPSGYDLISASVFSSEWLAKPDLESHVRENICNWFGTQHRELELLQRYDIKHALPSQQQPPPLLNNYRFSGTQRTFLAGEMTNLASINGALESGRCATNCALNMSQTA